MKCYTTPRWLTSRFVALATLGLVAIGCAGASPEVKVIGLSQAGGSDGARTGAGKVLLVFLEVVNPTNQDLRLSRFEYRLEAPEWLDAAGRVDLTRAVSSGSSTVFEVPVPLARARGRMPEGATYTLKGKIFAREDRVERSWKVRASGALASRSEEPVPLHVRIAGAE